VRDTPSVKAPRIRKLRGRNRSALEKEAPLMSMMIARGMQEITRFAIPERVVAKAKMLLGIRTRFISGPFHDMLAIATTVVCEKKIQGRYSDRK